MNVSPNLDTRSVREIVKAIAARFGLTSAAPLWQGIATAAYRRKIGNNDDFREWLNTVGQARVERHWGHETAGSRDQFSRLHLASQLYELTELLRRRIGSLRGVRALDAGASDGLFLERLGADRGVGVNLLESCARRIRDDGRAATVGDIERLPFNAGTFEHVICCETLEHVPNPIATLDELARVCTGRIYLTIPWLPRTRVNSRPEGWPEVERHIFEFSERDFLRIVTHVRARIVYRDYVHVFPEPRNAAVQTWLRLLMYPNYFPRLQYYELEPC